MFDNHPVRGCALGAGAGRPARTRRRSRLTPVHRSCGFSEDTQTTLSFTRARRRRQEMPTWRIPNIPTSAEAYYAPDNYHVIAQTQDPDGAHAPNRTTGALTWIFSDDGKTKWRVNDLGQDACSYFLPDGKRVLFTSTRDHMDFPLGNVSDQNNYPQGMELYIADLDGGQPQAPDRQPLLRRRAVDFARRQAASCSPAKSMVRSISTS